jgi:hypothetical protein
VECPDSLFWSGQGLAAMAVAALCVDSGRKAHYRKGIIAKA